MSPATMLTSEQVIRDLRMALDQAHDFAWSTSGVDQLRDAVQAVPGLRNQVDSLAGEIIDRAQSIGALGSRRPEHFMGSHTNEAPSEVRQDTLAMRWIRCFPEIADAYATGVLGRRHVHAFRRADTPVTHWAMLRDQHDLVAMARDCTFADFEVALQYWVNAADPDGSIPDEQVRQNDIHLRRHKDGSVTVKGRLDPLMGTAVVNAVEAETQRLHRNDLDENLDRSSRQRRAAAFAGLVIRGAARNDGTLLVPLINVVLGEQLAERLLESLEDPSIDLGLDPNDIDGRCEFIDGTPLHPKLALALLGAARLRRIVLDAQSRPIDVSHNARSFPQWMKDAALVSTRGRCSEPGCDARFHWLHADHRKPVAKGGLTRLDNLDPLCSEANRIKGDRWPPPANVAEPNPRPAA